jgi:hypothetical protein
LICAPAAIGIMTSSLLSMLRCHAFVSSSMISTPMNARPCLEVRIQVAAGLPCAAPVALTPAPPALLHQLYVHFGYSFRAPRRSC